ncbi:MAG: YhcH/YjgK/YiaL family protein [Rikenellaceae bacterium]
MIFDSLKNAEQYYSIAPRLKAAFEFIKSTDLLSYEPGRYEIDGDDIFVNIAHRELKKAEDAKLEVHNDYIDIQMMIEGDVESYGWSPRSDMTQPVGEFDAVKDIQFFEDKAQMYYTLKVGQFCIMLPEDAHAPMVGEGFAKRAIFKVKI